MTETETDLFRAVHEYADTTARSDLGAYGVTAYVFDSEARAKLLEAIKVYKIDSSISELELNEVVVEGQRALALLHAKAALCDAYEALDAQGRHQWRGDINVWLKLDAELSEARKALKKLQKVKR
jgi:hypothetical protein